MVWVHILHYNVIINGLKRYGDICCNNSIIIGSIWEQNLCKDISAEKCFFLQLLCTSFTPTRNCHEVLQGVTIEGYEMLIRSQGLQIKHGIKTKLHDSHCIKSDVLSLHTAPRRA